MVPINPVHSWPTSLDVALTAAFFGIAIIVPAAGYVFMVLDFRAYLRSLRRRLVHVSHYVHHLPDWARHDTPRAIAAFGLHMPCTEEDLKRAYRRLVKQSHPDHGGSQRRFLLLQANFDEAIGILHRELPGSCQPRWPGRPSPI